MAENKKSFIAYCDWGEIFDLLTDEEAGKDVNDRNPIFDDNDRFLKIIFEPIRLQLKRDLAKYETICAKNRENINKRWKKEKQTNTVVDGRKNRNTKNTDNDNDNDNDNDIIKEKIHKKEIAFKKSIEPFVEKYGKETCNEFFLYWSEPNKSKTKLRYEMEPTWDIARRLAVWARNKKTFSKNEKAEFTTRKYEQLG
jgi:hypothetical protein